MSTIKGNYWIDLLEKEKSFKILIENTVNKMVGTVFLDYDDMTVSVKDAISRELEKYGIKHHMGIFNLEYDLDLKYNYNYTLTGFVIKFVILNEDGW